jgi:hypothetical protein
MNTLQDKDYVILIMYNQSNAIIYLNVRLSLYILNKIILMPLENLNHF